jgi:hypothetical protein
VNDGPDQESTADDCGEGVAAPPEAPEKKKEPIYLGEMATAAFDEAHRIITSQDAMVKAGLRAAPYEPALRQADVFVAIAKLLDEIRPHLTEVLAITRAKKKAGPKNGKR